MVFMKRIAIATICLMLLAGCGPSTEDSTDSTCQGWTMFRANPQNTGIENSHCAPSTPRLEPQWKFAASGAVIQTPVSRNGKVFVGSIGKKFNCIDQYSGQEIWNYNTSDEVTSPAALTKDKVVFVTKEPSLFCLDQNTGDQIWSFKPSGQISIPTVDTNYVYFCVGSPQNEFYKLSLNDGEIIWAKPIGSSSRGCPAFLGTNLVLGCADGTLRLIDIDTGKQTSSIQTSGPITTSIVVVENQLFFSTYEGKMHCHDMMTGKERWVKDIGTNQESSPSIWRNNIYFGANDGYFYCLDARNGVQKWTYDTGVMRRIVSSPAVSNGMVWFASEDNYVYCFNAITGEKLWSYKTGDRVWSSPIITGNKIIIGCNDANVYCFGE